MKKFWIRILAMAAALAAACASGALADSTTRIDHEPIAVNADWTEGEMRPDEYHYHPFTVDQVGLVTVRVQSFYGNASFDLLDADLVSWDITYLSGTEGAPATHDLTYYLEPGLYYVRSNGASNTQGDYRIKISLEPCASDETEPNDDYHGAQPLASGATASGVLTEWDEHDYYAFTLTEETEVYMTANSEIKGSQDLTLYDGDMVEIDIVYGLHGYAEERLLPAGTYYIALSGEKGAYTLKVDFGTAGSEKAAMAE